MNTPPHNCAMNTQQPNKYYAAPGSPTHLLLTKIAEHCIPLIDSPDMRCWHISFSSGYNNVTCTAICELAGSPVRATLVVHLPPAMPAFVALNSDLKPSRRKCPPVELNALIRTLYSILRNAH